MYLSRNLIALTFVATLCLMHQQQVNAANILVFLPTFSPSHLVIQMAVAKVMAERNHNVTVVSSLPLKSEWLHPSMTCIQFDAGFKDMAGAITATQASGIERLRKSFTLMYHVTQMMGEILEDAKIQELMFNPGNKFDLMIFGYIYADFFFGLAEHFDCPVALVWPNIPVSPIMHLIGNPMEMTYAPLSLMNPVPYGESGGFLFRVKNLFAALMELTMVNINYFTIKDIYSKHFHHYAPLEKAKQRASMVLFSHHFSEKPARALVPAMIEIGGIHLNEEPKPLPKDLEAFVSNAEHGIILFCLGSNVKASHLQPNALEKIYKALSKLPQKVLWKYDVETNIPGNSSNILFRSWLPQGDILGHPNVKLFFGHGGKGGITEAKFYGVPIVGLPLFADQFMNMDEVVARGYGLSINHEEELSEEVIYKTVKEVLENQTYTNNVKQFSNLYRDRPLRIKDNAAYWLEYLLRYKGAPHLQSPLKSMSFVEANNLDVFVVIGLVIYLLWKIIKVFCKLVLRLLCGRNAQKTKKE
ncbi:UDP-glycosyltransferase UGT4 [Stomoxys calcitrans]|uniref:UDP-glycosyltransferase UGT4 n=1 Tax=Stomoxys calcitrans TaxID=35570 RepID=UPI0027E279B1|nr:UDP-glycosyltransferase UGT4 [Stomoxys calcitrans]